MYIKQAIKPRFLVGFLFYEVCDRANIFNISHQCILVDELFEK